MTNSELLFALLPNLRERLAKIQSVHEAPWILQHVLSTTGEGNEDPQLLNGLINDILLRRERGEPLAYIFGSWAFREHEFLVGPGVLIPRPETEELVEHALALVTGALPTRPVMIDAGAGSGCIGLSLAAELRSEGEVKSVDLYCVEQSAEARKWLEQNIARFVPQLPESKIEVVPLSWNDWSFPRAHLIVSNPPYVTEREYSAVDASVRDFEPRSALVPGDDSRWQEAGGPYRELMQKAAHSLVPGGWLFFEFGAAQAGWLESEARNMEIWDDVRMIRDLAGKNRIFAAQKSE
ncbi:MAG: peptide chain release factor N(5)-glutamine methyltransferase [Bdellovibrionales bacterium]|nr:peptide chain release factor N(5)-glutamine methyltransferase [Bdellovibrionales bacterium]